MKSSCLNQRYIAFMFELLLCIDWSMSVQWKVFHELSADRFRSKYRLFEIFIRIIRNATGCFWPVNNAWLKNFWKCSLSRYKFIVPIYLIHCCLVFKNNQQRMLPNGNFSNDYCEWVFILKGRCCVFLDKFIIYSQTDHRHN